ncbi:MAG: hypothetical protein R3A49_00750 [Acidimicrobiia bacterium]
MQYWEHGVAHPDTVEGHVRLRSSRRFALRNRFRLVAAGVAALAVATAGLPAAAGAPAEGKAAGKAAVAFPTADFEDPVFDAAADAIAAAAAFAGAAAAPGDTAGAPTGGGAATTPPTTPPTTPSSPPAPEAPSGGHEGGFEELPPLGAEAIDFSIRLTPTEVGSDGTFLAELVAVNTGDRTARATVSSVDFTLNGPDGVVFSGSFRIGLPVTVEAGEETSLGITVDPYMLSWIMSDVPEVIEAGTYSGPVTINVTDAAPTTHDVSITYTEDVDLAAWATEQCQSTIDGWDDGFVEYSATSSDGAEVTYDSEVLSYEPPTLEECLSWYGF